MIRKIALVATSAALAFGGISVVGAAAAGSAKPLVNATGTLSCQATGKTKFSPPLILPGSAVPTIATTKVTLFGCTGSSGVLSGKGTVTQNLGGNSCAAPASGSSGVFKLKGASKYSNLTVNFGPAVTDIGATTVNNTLTGTGAPGSFVGRPVVQKFSLDQSVTAFATACTPKTKGLKGSGGLKKTSYSGITGPSTFKIN